MERLQMTNPGGILDNLVIGGGLAGSMVAIRLAAAGCRVTVLEKERTAHHKVCGEFLSPEAVEYLHQVQIEPLSLGAAPIRFVRLSSRRRIVESTLPFTALSLSRFALDQALLARAEQSRCTVHRGIFVDSLTLSGDIWLAQLRDRQPLSARTVFLASGKHDLRGFARAPAVQGDLVAFKLHWQLQPAETEALRDFIELFLFSGGYGGLSLVEGDVANLCLVVKRERLRDLGGWTSLLASILEENLLLGRRLRGAKTLWTRPLALSSIPYGYLANSPACLWRIGDQAAVIPSFAGDGMAIALHSAALAAETYLAGGSPDLFTRRLNNQLRPGMSLATLISRVIVSNTGRSFAPVALSLFSNAMRWIAASTRIPERARLSSPNAGIRPRCFTVKHATGAAVEHGNTSAVDH
jgi:flavin-dependent dehydrogenase